MRLFLVAIGLLQGMVHGAVPSSYFGSDNAGYTSWLKTASYAKSVFVASISDKDVGVAVHWTIDNDTIRLAVAAKATGWAAFGLGESGSMLGADIVMFSAQGNKLVDSHVLDQSVMPLTDDCQSWTLVKSMVQDGFIIFEATRLLDTGDAQDRIFVDDSNIMMPPQRVLAAWGDSAEPSFHGSNTAKGAMRFFGQDAEATDELEMFAKTMAAEAEGSFLVQAKDFLIPTDETTYQHFCFSREDLLALNVSLDDDLHLIGYEAVIDPRAVQFVHHYVMTASLEPYNTSDPCYGFAESSYAWAPGALPFMLPSNVGGPLGSNGYQSFALQIHYDNPKGLTDQLDSSGVRMYYTSKKRQYNLGLLNLGDPGVALSGALLSTERGLTQHVFDCDGACSTSFITEPVTVMYEALHMHKSGVSMTNTQIRNGNVVREGTVEPLQ